MIYIGADHGGYALKESLKRRFRRSRIAFTDVGAFENDPDDDYPLVATKVTSAVKKRSGNRGIIICRSGVGASIAANKVRGIDAVLANDAWTASRGRRDEDTNVLALGAERISEQQAWKIVSAWLSTRFRNAVRDRRRLRQITRIERAR